MSRINIDAAVKKGSESLNSKYDISFNNVLELAQRGKIEGIRDAFLVGYYQGTKATKAEYKKEVTLVIEIKGEVCTPVSDAAIAHANDLCDQFKQESRLRIYAEGYEQALKDLGVRKAPDVGASKGSIQNGY